MQFLLLQQFLQFEQQYLQGDWTPGKVLLTLLVPLSLAALAAALWRRNVWLGVSVLALIAVAKSLWSVVFAGEAGAKVLLPAAVGLVLCGGCLWLGTRFSRSAGGPL